MLAPHCRAVMGVVDTFRLELPVPVACGFVVLIEPANMLFKNHKIHFFSEIIAETDFLTISNLKSPKAKCTFFEK